MADCDARVTVAVDSDATVDAAAATGIREVLVDVNVGLPRCGCDPADAGRLADRARAAGTRRPRRDGVRGPGHRLRGRAAPRAEATEQAMALLAIAHDAVGGDVISAGATVSYDLNTFATEIQAGSYALMDTAFAPMAPAFRPALWVEATRHQRLAPVGRRRLRAEVARHGPRRTRPSTAAGCSSSPTSTSRSSPTAPVRVGDRVRVWPAHVDPTVAYHERMQVIDGEDVVESWPVDLRGW